MMNGIREKQRLLVALLTTKAYSNGTMRESTQRLLSETIDFCARYERKKLPFPHDVKAAK
jgi:predicted nuclease with TOPRIM domain